MVKEWADLLLFANYKILVVATDDKGKKHKAQGGARVLYTSHNPCWDAKNRQGLPEELPLDFDALGPYLFGALDPVGPDPQIGASERKQGGAEDCPDVGIGAHTPKAEPAPAPEPPPVTRPDSDVPAALLPLLESANVTEDEVRDVIAQKGYFTRDTPWSAMENAGFVDGWVLPFWDRIVEMIENNPDRLPF